SPQGSIHSFGMLCMRQGDGNLSGYCHAFVNCVAVERIGCTAVEVERAQRATRSEQPIAQLAVQTELAGDLRPPCGPARIFGQICAVDKFVLPESVITRAFAEGELHLLDFP